ncbi:MAG: phospho-N-acetylmuramoyl-pentapeptide-transferase [Oscillospiraceae bacterium]|jgi:phospho-N-acetylmuramoyl-pentapeptide-transferase
MFGKLLLAFAISFGVAAVFGVWLVPYLKKIKAGQMIKENGPTWHMSKSGTPTMGGFIFIAGTAAACLTTGLSCMLAGDYSHIIVLFFALAFGAIGFLDDYEKLRHKQNLGLTAGKKFLLQCLVAAIFVFLLRCLGMIAPHLYIPFWNITVQMTPWFYYAFMVFVIVATVNAVNLTDGVDGLATGTSLPVFGFYAFVALAWYTASAGSAGSERYLALGIFAAGIFGGLCGFLLYNFNPAKVFMGDTGSLFLGGAVAGMAIAMDMPLIIITIGILYILEVLSDIIQVGYFKLSHGKRVFRMAPIHHHLEMGGFTGHKWTEKQLFALFTGISTAMAIWSYFGVCGRFSA